MRQFVLSLILHITVLSILLFSMSHLSQPPIVNKGEKIIHAVAIETTEHKSLENKIQDQTIQQQNDDAEQKKQEQEKIRQAEEQRRLAEQQRVEEIKIAAQKKIAEDQAIALRKQQEEAEKQRLAELKKQADAEAEKKHIAELDKQKKAEAEKKRVAELEKQRKAEQEKLKKMKEKELADKLTAQKKAEEAKKLKEQQQKQYEAAVALQKKIAAKQAEIAQQRSEAINGVVDQYKGLILEAIAAQWLVPPGVDPSLASQLMINVGAGGQVQNVQLVKSSGNALLDQSAIAAVYKASPLPMPPDKDAAAMFKQFSLTLRPEQVS